MPPVGDDPIPDEPETIVVTGQYYQEPWWYYWGFGGHPDDYLGGFVEIGGFEFPVAYDLIESPVTDEGLILVKTNITRALTAVEQKAVDQLMKAVADVSVILDALPDEAQIRMADGSVISATDLKTFWAKTDFVINEVGFDYDNLSDRGEADYNFGNPQISFNIDVLVAYDSATSGVISVVFHELGHMTSASRNLIQELSEGGTTAAETILIERFANDVAHAFSTHADFEIFPWDTYPGGNGFSPTPPTITLPDGGAVYQPVIPHWKIYLWTTADKPIFGLCNPG